MNPKFVKGYGFLSLTKSIVKNINKNLSGPGMLAAGQKPLGSTKKLEATKIATDALKSVSK